MLAEDEDDGEGEVPLVTDSMCSGLHGFWILQQQDNEGKWAYWVGASSSIGR